MPVYHPSYSTKSIHAGQKPQSVHGSVNVPIHASSTFAQKQVGKLYGQFDYSRCGNPTRQALQQCIAECHYAKHCITFSSGCAATQTIFELFESGDHFIICDDVYGGTNRLLNKIIGPKHKIQYTFVDMADIKNIQKQIKKNTKLIWIQSPTNPTLKLIDIKAVSQLAKKNNILTICDCTFTSPFIQNPILLGIDIAYDSCSKYINGHSDVIMGAICFNCDKLQQKLYLNAKTLGGCSSVFDSYLVLRGHKTLALRIKQATKNAFHIAHYLQKHSLIQKVYYPGLKSHPQYELAKLQMRGFGAMISLVIKGEQKNAFKFLASLKVFTLAESLGGVQSLAQHPAKMTHGSVPKEQRDALGIKDTFVRLSVGIEDLDDLISDINEALKKSQQ